MWGKRSLLTTVSEFAFVILGRHKIVVELSIILYRFVLNSVITACRHRYVVIDTSAFYIFRD